MRSRRAIAIAASGVMALGVAACGSSNSNSSSNASSGSSGGGSGSSTINGQGSTFAAPIYEQWGGELQKQGVTINYQANGSGTGVAALIAGQTDFAGSDPALKPDEEAQAKKRGEPMLFPMAFGAITVSYNVSGVDTGLKLDGATIADIFLGKITKWNDPAIAKLNPGVKLPGVDIKVIHRSDSSGTTAGFTKFLSAYSPTWASKVGSDKEVKWPTGTGASGNDGVASGVKQTDGAIGYVEEAYALQNNFTTASVKNKAGKFVPATLNSTTAAGEGIKVPGNLALSIIDSPNPTAYPIASQTFAIVYKDMCKAGVDQSSAQGVKKFLTYGLGAGQDVLGQLKYAKLPGAILSAAKAELGQLRCNGKPLA